jgi:hypothetical protein
MLKTAPKPHDPLALKPEEDAATEARLARAIARECFAGGKQRAHFDARTRRRLEELAAACPWLEAEG